MTITPTTRAGVHAMAAIKKDPRRCLAAFDYDGTLAPIVDDPTRAVPEPRAIEALTELASRVGTVAIVTGRPARVAVELAGFASVPRLGRLLVVGHYGLERWDAQSGELTVSEAPPGLDVVRRQLPDVLDALDLASADVEDKGLSVAVHVRRLPEPHRAFATMKQPLTELAERTGLAAEPGRFVMELRPPGMNKGRALRSLVEETVARSVMFIGDDLGDLAAYAEVEQLRSEGVPGLLICSGSDEVAQLAERADIVVDGPTGVARFVHDLANLLE